MDLISIVDMHKEFRKNSTRVRVFENLNLQIKDREFVILLGPNGCGKTTLLNLIAGFEKPDKGQILIDGCSVRRPTKDIGFVFQEFSLFPWKNVLDNVLTGLEINKVEKDDALLIAEDYLQMVGMAEFRHAYPYQLSAGMKQKVAIARTLAVNPRILLMDEPFANLDYQVKDVLEKELIRIWEKTRKTIVYVTHSADEALALGTRIILLNKNGNVETGIDLGMPHRRDREGGDIIRFRRTIKEILE